jgi:hypothetical protein
MLKEEVLILFEVLHRNLPRDWETPWKPFARKSDPGPSIKTQN